MILFLIPVVLCKVFPRIPWACLSSSGHQLDLLGSVGVKVLRKSVCGEEQHEVKSLFGLQFEQAEEKYST